MNNNRVTAVLVYICSLNIGFREEIIKRFTKIGSRDCSCADKRRHAMIHQLIVFFSLLGDDNNTEIRHILPRGAARRRGHDRCTYTSPSSPSSSSRSSSGRGLFTPIQSQEASCWWFLVHEVTNSAAHMAKCLTGALLCAHATSVSLLLQEVTKTNQALSFLQVLTETSTGDVRVTALSARPASTQVKESFPLPTHTETAGQMCAVIHDTAL